MHRGISGNDYDKHVERFDARSTLSKLNIQFWEAKQTFLRKIAKREDDCIIAYDAELDAKLELFKSIAETCQRLLCVIEGFQDRICILAHEESCIGRFFKECGRVNKNLIGKMLTATGKMFYYSAQQRIQLRSPLINLFQNLETFQYKAITDTLNTIEKMEKQRTAYRASLLWMKNLSLKLDPDSYPDLEKFRKVQNHVRKTKQKYDKLKVDCIQKVDMLNVSRCNMLNQMLSNYQSVWLTFWSNTAYTIATVSNYIDKSQISESSEMINVESENTSKDKEIKKYENQNLLEFEEKVNIENSEEHLINQKLQEEEEYKKKIDSTNIDNLLNFNMFSDEEFINQNVSENLRDLQIRNKQVDDLLDSSDDSKDLILLNDMLDWSSSEKSFNKNTSYQFDEFNSTKINESFIFSSFQKEKDQNVTKKHNKTEMEKKKWSDLFSDLDIFDSFNNKKLNQGDC